MSEKIINIPGVPAGTPPELVDWMSSVTQALGLLQGLGRYQDVDRAIRLGELRKLGYDIDNFSMVSTESPIAISTSNKTPLAPTSLTVTVGAWVHTVRLTLPDDDIVSHIEIWAAKTSQVRDDANRIYILTVLPDDYGKTVEIKIPIPEVTADYTYWVRSISFAGNHSAWCPPDSQGGYVVLGSTSVQEAIDKVLEILNGEITEDELYIDLKSKINLISGLSDRLAAIESNLDSLEDWVSGTIYLVDDVIVYDDKVYLCILNTVSPHTELPTNETYWEKIGESATIAGNVAANSTAIDTLETTVNHSETGVTATASKLAILKAVIDTPTTGLIALLSAEQTARASGDSAIATSVETISTQVNHGDTGLPATYSAVQTQASSIDGIKAKYAVKLDVNGHVTGIELINDGTTGEFGILADKFKVFLPDGTGSAIQAFVAGLVDGVATVGVDGNLIVDGTIISRHIQANTIKAKHIDASEVFVFTIQSSNYVAGVSGWKIDKDGNMEMNGGSITITGGLPYSKIADTPSSLSGINSTEGDKLDGVAAGATVGANETNASATLINSNVLINSNGTLTGAGSGQVSLDGLGAKALALLDALGVSNFDSTVIVGNAFKTGLVTAETIGALQIIANAANIKDGIITTAHIRNANILMAQITNLLVDTGEIKDLAVETAKINDHAVSYSYTKTVATYTATLWVTLIAEDLPCTVFVLGSLVQSYYSAIYLATTPPGKAEELTWREYPLAGTLACRGYARGIDITEAGIWTFRLESGDTRNTNGTSLYILVTKK